MTNLDERLKAHVPADLSAILSTIARTSIGIRDALPFSSGMAAGINPSGERQAKVDVYANDSFTANLIATGEVAEVASEEMEEAAPGPGTVHVAMDPLDGSSNISTNNPLGSIFGFYSSTLPCSGKHMVGAAFVTYGPMLTLTFSAGESVDTFVAVEREGRHDFILLEKEVRIPDEPEVFGFGGQRREWIPPVERFVTSLEGRGMKLRYGGTFVGDYNQVLRYGGIFGYPALKTKPKGKLRVLYEAAPMAFITRQAHGRSTDGIKDVLLVEPATLAEPTPLYVGTSSTVKEVEESIAKG